jgi:hypothetical protein
MKKPIYLFLCVLAVTCVLTLWAAEGIAASESYVKILKIEPDPSVPLKVGSEIHFKVKIEYEVRDDSAMISLIIQKGEYSNSPDTLVGSVNDVLSKGKGNITLEKTVKIPDTMALQIFTPLLIPGKTQTSIVDMKFYKVVK